MEWNWKDLGVESAPRDKTELTYSQTQMDLLQGEAEGLEMTYWGREGGGQDTEIQCRRTLLAKTATLPKPTRWGRWRTAEIQWRHLLRADNLVSSA